VLRNDIGFGKMLKHLIDDKFLSFTLLTVKSEADNQLIKFFEIFLIFRIMYKSFKF